MYMEEHKEQDKKGLEVDKAILNKNTLIILAILVGFLLGIISIIVLVRSNVIDLTAKQYVYVDVERVISEVNNDLLEQIKNNQIDDQEVGNRLSKAKTKFDNLLANYTKKNNAVVFSANKVISGTKDITEYFITKLKEIE